MYSVSVLPMAGSISPIGLRMKHKTVKKKKSPQESNSKNGFRFFFFGFVFLASERLLLLLVPSLWLFHRIVAPKFIVVDYKYMVRNNLHEERGEMGSGLHNHGPLKIVTKE
jgi:hypothetical protein